ncbi:16654_t:CDS:2, partial [Dentiscutata erythropus]
MDKLLGVLFRTKQLKETIDIVVGLSVGNFEYGAFETAIEVKTSVLLKQT